jgi:hypothetical protein
VVKTLKSFVVLAEQGAKVNCFAVVFNNLYSRLRDLFASTKPGASRNNTEFKTTQVVDILLWNWFPVDPTFILPKVDEEEEGAIRPLLGALAKGTNIVSRSHF